MPIYEYQCPRCDHIEEVMVAWLDAGQTWSCPVCSAEMKKIMSTPAKGIVK